MGCPRIVYADLDTSWLFVIFGESHPKALTFQSNTRSHHAIPAVSGIYNRGIKGHAASKLLAIISWVFVSIGEAECRRFIHPHPWVRLLTCFY